MNDFAKILSIIWIISTFWLITRTVASKDDGAEHISAALITWAIIGWFPLFLARVMWAVL